MRSLCIMVTGDPVPLALSARGDFATLIRETVGDVYQGEWSEWEARSESDFPDPATLSGLVITGSASSVTDHEPWVLSGFEFLLRVVSSGVPVLGVCFGHQMLAEALGGRVEKNPRGREIGTVDFTLLGEDPVVFDAPGRYRVNMSHMDSVVRLPAGAQVLGYTSLDPHAALRFGEKVWGVQFHPEFDREIVGHYAHTRADILRQEGLDPEQLTRSATDTPAGAEVLRRFARLVQSSHV